MIAARYCPPEGAAICHGCDRFSVTCRQVWRALDLLFFCRRCRKEAR